MERKEAIEVIKKNWPDSSFTMLREALETLIPELKESEGERMVKFIKNQLFNIKKTITDNYELDAKLTKAIDWLEKQGEPVEINPTEFDTRLQALIRKFDCLTKEELAGSLSFWANVVLNDGTYKPYEKQGQQKPIKEHDVCNTCDEKASCVIPCPIKLVEQKPTQETEPTPVFRIGDILKRKDKDYTFRVDRIQGGYYHCDRNHGAFFPIEEQGNWELVEQTWSEEDEQMLTEIVKDLQVYKSREISRDAKDAYQNEIDWLKSIRPRNRWKPTKRQLLELSCAISGCSFDTPTLVELEQDLKKLIEE